MLHSYYSLTISYDEPYYYYYYYYLIPTTNYYYYYLRPTTTTTITTTTTTRPSCSLASSHELAGAGLSGLLSASAAVLSD